MKQIIELDNGTFKVLNSREDDYYIVNLAGQCSCMGFGYRRKCRHIDLLKKKGLLNKDRVIKKEKGHGYAGTNMIPKITWGKEGIKVRLIQV